MPRTKLDHLKRKLVEIRANGLLYKGVLLEATESEVTLKGRSGYLSIPMDRITSVVDPQDKLQKADTKYVDSSFWNADVTPAAPAASTLPPKPEEE